MPRHPQGLDGALKAEQVAALEQLYDDELMTTVWAVAGRITRHGEETWTVPLESVV